MLHLSHHLYRDNADRLTFRLILPTLLQQRFPSLGREIRWSLDGVPLDDARKLALDLARRIRDLRFRLGDLKTAEGLLQELQRIQASIPPLGRRSEPPALARPHSSQVPCPVHDLSLGIGRQRFEQLRRMPTFLLREQHQLTLQVPLPDLLGAAYPLMLKTLVFELHTLNQQDAEQRAAFILQGLAELNERLQQHLDRGEWLPLYQASFQLEALRRYLLPDHGLHFHHDPRWLPLRPQDLRESDHEHLRRLDAPAGDNTADHRLHPAIGGAHQLDIRTPRLLREHYPQLPEQLTLDLHTQDLHEAVLKAGFVLERFGWLGDLVQQGQQFGGGMPSLHELRLHVEAIRARLRPEGDCPQPPLSTPPSAPTPGRDTSWGLPTTPLDTAPANPLGALFASGFQPRSEQRPELTEFVEPGAGE